MDNKLLAEQIVNAFGEASNIHIGTKGERRHSIEVIEQTLNNALNPKTVSIDELLSEQNFIHVTIESMEQAEQISEIQKLFMKCGKVDIAYEDFVEFFSRFDIEVLAMAISIYLVNKRETMKLIKEKNQEIFGHKKTDNIADIKRKQLEETAKLGEYEFTRIDSEGKPIEQVSAGLFNYSGDARINGVMFSKAMYKVIVGNRKHIVWYSFMSDDKYIQTNVYEEMNEV